MTALRPLSPRDVVGPGHPADIAAEIAKLQATIAIASALLDIAGAIRELKAVSAVAP